MKSFLFFTFLCLYSLFSFSQEQNREDAKLALTSIGNIPIGFWIPGKISRDIIEGSVYLFPNFIGQYEVISKKGDTFKLYNLNYNLITKSLESQISKDSIFQYNLGEVDCVINKKSKYKFIDESQVKGLLLVIYNCKKLQLYKEFTSVVKKASFNPLTQEKIGNDAHVRAESYYFHKNKFFEKIKLNKKTILRLLSDRGDLVGKFVSKNNLSYQSEGDIVEILNYYESL